jgi:hypothetical protein
MLMQQLVPKKNKSHELIVDAILSRFQEELKSSKDLLKNFEKKVY